MLKDLMMGAAKATYEQLWKHKMQQIKDINEAAYHWLYNLERTTWCKYAFSHYPKCDILMNNLSKSFNITILVARGKPIITMCQWIRMYLMNKFATLRDKLKNYIGEVMTKPLKSLDYEVEKSGNWVATWGGDRHFEVTHIASVEEMEFKLVLFSIKKLTSHKSNVQKKNNKKSFWSSSKATGQA